MSDSLTTNIDYLAAVLREGVRELNDRNSVPKSTRDVLRDACAFECLLVLIEKVIALEKQAEASRG